MQLTEQFHIPDENADACDRLTTLVERHAGRLLREEYWTESHIEGVDSHTGRSYTYIRDDEYAAFDGVAEYVYSRCDIVGAINVGRKYLSDSKMQEAKPVAYMETGNAHASFPSPAVEGARSTGVQSTAEQQQDTASGCQTRLTQYCTTERCGESDMGGLHQNHGSNTGRQLPRSSITRYVLANTG